MGRPSLYTSEYCEQIQRLMETGASVSAAARALGVHRDTLYAWAKMYPDFKEALALAIQSSCIYWEDMLEEMVRNPKSTASQLKAVETILSNRHKDLYSKTVDKNSSVELEVEGLSDTDLQGQIDKYIAKVGVAKNIAGTLKDDDLL